MWNMGLKTGQFKIQQMAFMILAVFLFFVLVGLFFIRFQFSDINESFADLQKEQALSSLRIIANMPELSYSSSLDFTLDEDKLKVMSSNFSSDYEGFWPVASVKVYKVFPQFDEVVRCPAAHCNYYEIYDSGQKSTKEYSTFVSLCKRVREGTYTYDSCEIGKLSVGVKNAAG
jgi:hypothetical protein